MMSNENKTTAVTMDSVEMVNKLVANGQKALTEYMKLNQEDDPGGSGGSAFLWRACTRYL